MALAVLGAGDKTLANTRRSDEELLKHLQYEALEQVTPTYRAEQSGDERRMSQGSYTAGRCVG